MSNEFVSSNDVLKLAKETLSNRESQTPAASEQEEQRVPFERFKEVNDERKALLEEKNKLLEQLLAQQSVQTETHSVQQQPPQQALNKLFTEDELQSFEADLIVNPRGVLEKYGETLIQRGVDERVKTLEQTFDQRFQQMNATLAAQQLPNIIAQYKQSRFNPSDTAEMQAFDQAVATIDPQLLLQEGTLDNVRLAAIGYVADQRRNGQLQTTYPFTESPSGSTSTWGAQQQTRPTAPSDVINIARMMGVNPDEATALHQAMERSNVYR